MARTNRFIAKPIQKSEHLATPYLAVVSWEDACSREGDYAGDYIPYLVESAGWIVRKDDAITIASWRTISGPDATEHYKDVLVVPIGMVRKVKRVRA